MKEMLIMVDSGGNNNKYYQLELSGDTVTAEYGRVGSRPQKRTYGGGQKTYDKKKREKLKKGYVLAQVCDNDVEITTDGNGNVMDIAMSQIITDDNSKALIKRLVQQNIHNITSNTKITYDIKTGYFKTPLGVIKEDAVLEAKSLLDQIESMFINGEIVEKDPRVPEFKKLNDKYFMIIPTVISTLRYFHNFLNTSKKISEQRDICDALLESLKIIDREKKKQDADKKDEPVELEKVFDAEVKQLTDKVEYDRIVKYFETSKNSSHGHGMYKVVNIYTVSLGEEAKNFRYDLTNQMELWHGTKVANLLSILKSGLLMPKYSPGACTGYMFGKGLYFSDQSTKSLNYCDGMYWNNAKRQDRIYMFVADIAMGNYQVPSGSRSCKPDKGYDSYWAQARKSGVRNNEMIVFNNNQIKLKYLLEISK